MSNTWTRLIMAAMSIAIGTAILLATFLNTPGQAAMAVEFTVAAGLLFCTVGITVVARSLRPTGSRTAPAGRRIDLTALARARAVGN